MEPVQNPPKPRRRRWLIVALLFVLTSGVAWWNWPRGDARFVGKWNMHTSDGDVLQVLTFSKAGRVDCFLPHRDEHEPTRSYWVEADKLVFGHSVADALLGPPMVGGNGRLKSLFFVLIGKSQTVEQRFAVVGKDEIRLEQSGFDGPFVTTLRRIPE